MRDPTEEAEGMEKAKKKKWGEGEEAGEENFYVPFFNSKFSQTCLALIFNSYFHYSLFAL